MPNLTSVTVTSGVPTAGTGTVSTIDALMADGGQVTLGAKADAKSTASDTTAITAMSVWKQISFSIQAAATSLATLVSDVATLYTSAQTISAGAQLTTLPTDQGWKTGMSNKVFVAAFSTLTRPANTTAYSAADSVSDNATAGSVTALSATISDTNDDPIFISDILVSSTDTGLAGKRIRAYLFNSDPTASTGVGGGDNAAYSQKKAGYIGSFSGVLETGFSDGAVGRLVPSFNDSATSPTPNASAGGFLAVKPTSGAKTLFIQYQTLDAFTPSANSTTIIGSARGWQARVA
jgi:hypothetical protein